MKYLILAVAFLYAANAQTCYTYACNSIGAAGQCVGNDAVSNVNINMCPTGQYCPYGAIFQPGNLANQTCMNTTTPQPGPAVNNIPPGNTCNSTRGDTCNKGQCTKSVCVSKNAIGSACTLSVECPVGAYCNATVGGFCAAIVAPGGFCNGTTSTTSQWDQCGYKGYCINSVCTLPWSLPAGVTSIPSTAPQASVNYLCSTGYASSVGSTNGNYSCVAAPTNLAANLNGVTADTQCNVTITNANGSTSIQTNTPICGYNQDTKSYCPWALGDAAV